MKNILEGLVSYPWAKPAKRMINGVEVPDSDEEEEVKAKTAPRVVADENQKIALVVDTNVLLKQTQLKEMLRVSDQNTFDEMFEVVTLDSVMREIKDDASRRYVNTGLTYSLDIKDSATFLDKQDIIQV